MDIIGRGANHSKISVRDSRDSIDPLRILGIPEILTRILGDSRNSSEYSMDSKDSGRDSKDSNGFW